MAGKTGKVTDPDLMPGASVPVAIGGTTYALRFTNRAQFHLKRVAGYALAQAVFQAGTMDAHAITHLIWAGRLHAEEDLEVEQVIDALEPAEYPTYLQAITAAVGQAMPWLLNAAAGKKKPPARAGSRPGRTRGRSR